MIRRVKKGGRIRRCAKLLRIFVLTAISLLWLGGCMWRQGLLDEALEPKDAIPLGTTAPAPWADRVVELASSQIGRTEGDGPFRGNVWADENWTYCERFVRRVIEVACNRTNLPVFDKAYAAYEAYRPLVRTDTPPPKGAVVFYSYFIDGTNYGHVGIADGNGNVISVVGKRGTPNAGVQRKPLDAFPNYLGWIYPEERTISNPGKRAELLRQLKDLFSDQFIERGAWGAWPSTVASRYANVKGIIVHHTVSSNSISDWTAEVRHIQNQHRAERMGDIGYHFLIDPQGNVYEGRGGLSEGCGLIGSASSLQVVEGAHAKNWNVGTVGIAFLGCFLSEREWNDQSAEHQRKTTPGSPSPAALESAKKLIRWIVEQVGPGSCFIIAHRDVEEGKPHCPGWNVYTRLEEIRKAVGVSQLSITISRTDFPARGDSAALTGVITVTSNHPWQVYRGSDWIEIVGGSKGIYTSRRGNGTVTFQVRPNNTGQPREGEIVVGGVIVRVRQVGTPTPPSQVGSLRVTIEPAGARNAGAQWRLTSGPDISWKNSGATLSNLPVGTYTVTFKDVPGWIKPADVQVVIKANQKTTISRTYIRSRPPTVSRANQYRSDGVTVIPEGRTTPESTVVFKATVSDPDKDRVKLQIELRQITEAFTGTPTWESGLVASGTQVSWTRGELVNASYKWRYRAVDERGLASNWVEFGTPGKTDFVIQVGQGGPIVRAPTVETRAAAEITSTSATIQGVITNDGGASIVERRFVWGTTPSCSDGWTNQVTVSGNTFSFRLTGLKPNTTYYFRASARNVAGWGQGTVLSFRTSSSLTFTDLQPAEIVTSQSTYDAELTATGSNFYNVVEITLRWSGPDSGEVTWKKGTAIWNQKVKVKSDNTMILNPRVLANVTGTTTKTWTWTVILKDNTGASASRQFKVIYQPAAAPTPYISGVSPAQPKAQPTRQWLAILGSGFVAESQVILRFGNSTYVIPRERTKFVSASQINVYVGLTDPGTWTAQVVNPGNKYSNIYQFQVKP